MKYSKDGIVEFNPKYHTYTNLVTGKRLTSVTTFLKNFENVFDSDFFSKKIAKKRGITQEQVLKEWKDKADLSCKVGTDCHYMVEHFILHGEILTPKNPKEEIIVKYINDFLVTKRVIPIETEYIVYNDYLAGQVDFIAESDGIFIKDFKTNEKIETYSYGKYMLNEFSMFPDSNFYKYSLQLDIYEKLIKEPIKGKFIIHIKENEYLFYKCEEMLKNVDLDYLCEKYLSNK
jgi:hypothetical protein